VPYQLMRKKEVQRLRRRLCEEYPGICGVLEDTRVGAFTVVDKPKAKVYIIGSLPAAFELGGKLYPTLIAVRLAGIDAMPYAVVDDGAVKPLLNGADVMAPGIKEHSSFRKGDVVAVWRLDKKTPLVVGEALMSSDEVDVKRKGKAIKNVHRAGDGIWQASLSLMREFTKS